ncbi:hypothetical protein EON65_50345 [archaeon]|nr:MAG: hypothetical protein EON65_50345 [archaeon]
MRIITHNAGKAGNTKKCDSFMKKCLQGWNKSDVIFLQEISATITKFIADHLHKTELGSRSRFWKVYAESSKTAVLLSLSFVAFSRPNYFFVLSSFLIL